MPARDEALPNDDALRAATLSDGEAPAGSTDMDGSMPMVRQYLALVPRENGQVVVRIDGNQRVADWESRAARLLGFSRKEVLGTPYGELLTDVPRQAEVFQQVLHDVADDDVPRPFEVQHRTQAGRPMLLRGVASVVRSSSGSFEGWLLVMHRAVEEQCLDCRLLHYLAAITSDSADAIIILDENERIRSWNRGAEGIYGFAAEDILGQPVEVLVPDERQSAGELEYLRRLINEQGYIRNYETRRMTSEGMMIPVELTRSAIRDSQGRLIGSSVIVRDITMRKTLEERLLHTERLAVVGRMAAQVAHELRNPLSSISLNAELLADELSSLPEERVEEARSLLGSIVAEIERLAAVSEEYLQFARLPELAPEPTDVTLVMEDLAEFTELELTQAGVDVKVEVENVPHIAVDRKQLRQALLNLIRNALDAMADGGTLMLKIALVDGGKVVEMSVADTGPGVQIGYEEQIFEPFFSTKESGTGLGLSLARRVAHEHGGELRHLHTPGGGATFALRLPAQGPDLR